jgi:hypothetical protein
LWVAVLLEPRHRTFQTVVFAVAVVILWMLFFAPIWCFTPQATNGRLCTNPVLGLLGTCGIHRFRKVFAILRLVRRERAGSPIPSVPRRAYQPAPTQGPPSRLEYVSTVAAVVGALAAVVALFLM